MNDKIDFDVKANLINELLNDVSMLWITNNESFNASEADDENEINVKVSFNVFDYFFA